MVFSEEQKTRVYEQYSEKVLRYFCSRTNDYQLSSDLMMDVFTKVYQKLDSFDTDKASVSTWIYTIARNRLIDYFRTRRVSEELPETLESGGLVEDSILKTEELDTLAKALRALPERERDLIVLRYYSGLTLKEAADRSGISYSYAKLLHQGALAKLRDFFEKD